jgi:hypothetical protein
LLDDCHMTPGLDSDMLHASSKIPHPNATLLFIILWQVEYCKAPPFACTCSLQCGG